MSELLMKRRTFLAGLGALIGGAVIERTFPFRAYSFPEIVKPLNSGGTLFRVGDRFTTEAGLVYEVVALESKDNLARTEMDETDFRSYVNFMEAIKKGNPIIREYPEYHTCMASVPVAEVGSKIYGNREFNLKRGDNVNKIITRFSSAA